MKSARASAIAFSLRWIAWSLRPLCILEHCNQDHDHNRHDGRTAPSQVSEKPVRAPMASHTTTPATQLLKNGPRLTACTIAAAIRSKRPLPPTDLACREYLRPSRLELLVLV